MGVDKATRAVLKDIAADYPSMLGGESDIARIRADYDRLFSAWCAGPVAPTREDWVSIGEGEQAVRVLSVEPVGAALKGSILFIHGGGWSLGTALCYAPLARFLAAQAGMRVIVPELPLSPEHPFPAAYEALASVVCWMEKSVSAPIYLSGDSAGGSLAAALSMDDRLNGAVRGLALFYPVMDLRADAQYRSRRRFGSGKYFLSEAGILGAAAWYCADGADPADPRLSPILTPTPERTPPTFILLPEFDPLKDEGAAYAALLQKSGVTTQVYHAKRTIHGCVSFSGRIAEGRAGLEAAAAFLCDLSAGG